MADDPGGGANSPPNIASIQENFHQQQAKITALKELVRQSEAAQGTKTANAQEKVRNIAQRLTHLKSKASRSRQGDKSISDIKEEINFSSSSISSDSTHNDDTEQFQPSTASFQKARSETPGSEKIQLLRQQMEQNRLRMAERENNKRGIEEMVTQLKAKFDSSQMTLEKSSQHHLGRSIGDLSIIAPHPQREKYQSASDLTTPTTNFDKDRIRYLEKRVRDLEATMKTKEADFLTRDPESEHLKTIKNLENKILDYEEHLKEKECIIAARTQAVSLLSENMSMKGKNTVDLLEDTKQEMYKMQQRFIEAEETFQQEIDRLKMELDEKNNKIANMDEVNDILETARYDLTIKNSGLETQIQDVQEYSTKLNELNKFNQSLQHRIGELESHKSDVPSNDEELATLEDKIAKLQIENDDLKKSLQEHEVSATDHDLRDKIHSLETLLQEQRDQIESHVQSIQTLENDLQEKTIECNVLNANFSVLQEKLKSTAPKSLFSVSHGEEAEAEITKLKTELDDANKNMIKTKLKMKQLQKQVDSVKKSSDLSKQVVALTDENEALRQKINELPSVSASSTPASDTELGQRLQILENTCQNQVSAIQLLEEQKVDMNEDLHQTMSELTLLKDHLKSVDDDDETERVKSHMDSIAQEEQIEAYLKTISDLQETNERLSEEKTTISTKLNNYMTENFELLDKLEKLSKGSSAESIEIVENLTQQEKLEMEELQKALQTRDMDESDNTMMSKDLSESLVKLREESSELMHKIEMFTNERREVLDKMETLNSDNAKLMAALESLSEAKAELERKYVDISDGKSKLEKQLEESNAERIILQNTIKELNENRSVLSEEINVLIKSTTASPDTSLTEDTDVGSSSSKAPEIQFSKEPYEKSIRGLEQQLELFRKGKGNVKMEASKKVLKEAKNVNELMLKLLVDYEQMCANQVGDNEQKLQQLLQAKQSEIVLNKVQCSALEQKLRDYQREMEKYRQEAEDLQRDSERLHQELIKQTTTLNERDEANREQSDTMTATIKTLQDTNEQLHFEIKELESSIHTKQNEVEQLRVELESRNETTNQEIDILKVLVAEQKAQLIETITEYQNEIDEKAERILDLEQQLKSDESKQQVTASREQYISELNEKMVALKVLFDENNDLLEQQAQELRNKQETIETLNNQIMELYKSMEVNSQEVIRKEDEINYLQEVLDSNRNEMQTLNEKNRQNDVIIHQLNGTIQDKLKEIQTLENRASTDAFDKKINELNTHTQELENKNKEQLDKLKKFAANLKKKNAQCLELEEKLLQAGGSSNDKSLNDRIKQLTQELSTKSKELEDSQHELQQLTIEHNVMKHEHNQVSVALQQSSGNNDRVLKDLVNEKQSLEDDINKLNSLNQSLSADIQKLNQTIQQMTSELDGCNHEIVNKSAAMDNFNARLNEKVIAMEQLVKEVETREAELVLLRNNAQETASRLAEVSEDLRGKNIKIEKCKAVIKEKNKEIRRLQDSVEEITKKVKSLEENIDRVEENDENIKLQEEMIVLRKSHEDEVAKLQQELLDMEESDQRTLQKEITRLRESAQHEIDRLQLILSEKDNSFQNEIRILKEASQMSIDQLQHDISERQIQQKQLQEELTTLKETFKLQQINMVSLGEISTAEIEKLHVDRNEIQLQLMSLKQASEKEIERLLKILTDDECQQNEYEAEIQRLNDALALSQENSQESVLTLKVQENLHFIETLELENTQLKDKISKLEEGIGYVEERRLSLERQANLLGSQLEEKSLLFEQNEDELVRRLECLSNHDEIIEQKLKEADNQKQELIETVRDMNDSKNKLTQKIDQLENQMKDIQMQLQQVDEEKSILSTQNANIQAELKQKSAEFERKIAEKREEVDVLENDLSLQLQTIENARRHLQEDLEKSRDENADLQCDVVRYKEMITSLEQSNSDLEREMTWIKMQNESLAQDQVEVQELRMQIVHDQTEIENLKAQGQTVQQNHDIEVHALKQQIAELDSLRAQIGQNQTDDQVFIQNENERLQGLLATKEVEIQNYQRQNLQLQMAATFGGGGSVPNQNDPFAAFSAPAGNAEKLILNEKITELERKLQGVDVERARLSSELITREQSIKHMEQQLQDLKVQMNQFNIDFDGLEATKNAEIQELKEKLSKVNSVEPVTAHAATTQNINFSAFAGQEVVPPQQPNQANVDLKIEELQRNVTNLEEYITQLQIQLRISTNDCEQLAQTVESLEAEIDNRAKTHQTELQQSAASFQEEIQLKNKSNDEEMEQRTKSLEDEFGRKIKDLEEEMNSKTKAHQDELNRIHNAHKEETALAVKAPAEEIVSRITVSSQAAVPISEPIPFDISAIEQLIVPNLPNANIQPAAPIAPLPTVPSFNSSIFFGGGGATPFDDAFTTSPQEPQPVVEEIIVPKKAYICHPSGTEADIEIDVQNDGWGFGSDDAVLEEQHRQMSAPTTTIPLLSPNTGIEVKLQEYEDKVMELSLERDRLRNENIALQVKSGKMLKKLKEYKSKNDELSAGQSGFKKSASVEPNELDLAIQEELNSQIRTLEMQVKEVKTEHEKNQSERQSLLKRVDVLTAANDRLTEMKERQDTEMEVCKTKCRQLTMKLEKLEEWSDDNYTKATSSSVDLPSDTNDQINGLNKQIVDLKLDNDDIQALLDEEKENSHKLSEKIKKLQESMIAQENLEQDLNANAEKLRNLLADNSNLKLELVRRQEMLTEAESKISRLTAQINDYQATIDLLSQESTNISTNLDQLKEQHKHKIDENYNLLNELSALSDKNTELSDEIQRMKATNMFNDQPQQDASKKAVDEYDMKIEELAATIQYKDAEIMHLNQKVEDAIQEDQTPSLVQEILGKNADINSLRNRVQELENDKVDLQNNLSIQLTQELQQQTGKSENNELIATLKEENRKLLDEQRHMSHELQVLNEQVMNTLDLEDKFGNLVLEMDVKNTELTELKNSLTQLSNYQQRSSDSPTDERVHQLEAHVQTLNAQWEAVLEQRCSELAESWRQHLTQREAEFDSVRSSLQQEILSLHATAGESTGVSEAMPPPPPQIDSDAAQQKKDDDEYDAELVSKMQLALENQEVEIVTLKEQLAIRSAEYARIAAQVDPFGQLSTMSNMTSMDFKAKKQTESLESNVHKSELDLAWYMLHQRDMRCEELTEELISLLGERDTLQLKLSNSIRQFEEFKRKLGSNTADAHSDIDSTDTSPEKLPTTQRISSVDSNTETQQEFNKLNAKISQLHGVSHSRDKTLREERAQRQRQMALLQRDVSTLPPEAVAELIGADYTLSRTSQSPSSVLLNWLWGKSTPKPPDH